MTPSLFTTLSALTVIANRTEKAYPLAQLDTMCSDPALIALIAGAGDRSSADATPRGHKPAKEEDATYDLPSDDFITDDSNDHEIVQPTLSPSHSIRFDLEPLASPPRKWNGQAWSECSFTATEYQAYLSLGVAQYMRTCEFAKLRPLPPVMQAVLNGGATANPGASLRLTHYGLSEVEAAPLSELLRCNTTLTHMDLDDNRLGGAGVAALARGLMLGRAPNEEPLDEKDLLARPQSSYGNRTLRTLILSRNQFDHGASNVLSPRVVATPAVPAESNGATPAPLLSPLGRMLSLNSSLTTLHLSSCRLGDRHILELVPALSDDLHRSRSGLTTLRLDHNAIGDRGARAIADMLDANSTLTHLDLAHNCIRDPGGVALAEAVAVHASLTVLCLGHNGVGRRGGLAFARAISNSSFTLQTLYLEHNQIAGAETWRELMRALVANQRLRSQVVIRTSGNASVVSSPSNVNRTLPASTTIGEEEEKSPSSSASLLRSLPSSPANARKYLARARSKEPLANADTLSSASTAGVDASAPSSAMIVYTGLQHINLSGNRLDAADSPLVAAAQRELSLVHSDMIASLQALETDAASVDPIPAPQPAPKSKTHRKDRSRSLRFAPPPPPEQPPTKAQTARTIVRGAVSQAELDTLARDAARLAKQRAKRPQLARPRSMSFDVGAGAGVPRPPPTPRLPSIQSPTSPRTRTNTTGGSQTARVGGAGRSVRFSGSQTARESVGSIVAAGLAAPAGISQSLYSSIQAPMSPSEIERHIDRLNGMSIEPDGSEEVLTSANAPETPRAPLTPRTTGPVLPALKTSTRRSQPSIPPPTMLRVPVNSLAQFVNSPTQALVEAANYGDGIPASHRGSVEASPTHASYSASSSNHTSRRSSLPRDDAADAAGAGLVFDFNLATNRYPPPSTLPTPLAPLLVQFDNLPALLDRSESDRQQALQWQAHQRALAESEAEEARREKAASHKKAANEIESRKIKRMLRGEYVREDGGIGYTGAARESVGTRGAGAAPAQAPVNPLLRLTDLYKKLPRKQPTSLAPLTTDEQGHSRASSMAHDPDDPSFEPVSPVSIDSLDSYAPTPDTERSSDDEAGSTSSRLSRRLDSRRPSHVLTASSSQKALHMRRPSRSSPSDDTPSRSSSRALSPSKTPRPAMPAAEYELSPMHRTVEHRSSISHSSTRAASLNEASPLAASNEEDGVSEVGTAPNEGTAPSTADGKRIKTGETTRGASGMHVPIRTIDLNGEVVPVQPLQETSPVAPPSVAAPVTRAVAFVIPEERAEDATTKPAVAPPATVLPSPSPPVPQPAAVSAQVKKANSERIEEPVAPVVAKPKAKKSTARYIPARIQRRPSHAPIAPSQVVHEKTPLTSPRMPIAPTPKVDVIWNKPPTSPTSSSPLARTLDAPEEKVDDQPCMPEKHSGATSSRAALPVVVPISDPIRPARRIHVRPMDVGSLEADELLLAENGARAIGPNLLSRALAHTNARLPPEHRIPTAQVRAASDAHMRPAHARQSLARTS